VKSLDAVFLLRTTPKFSGRVGGASTVTSRPNITSQQLSAGSGSSSRSIGTAQVPIAGHTTVGGGDSRGESLDSTPSPCNLSIQAPYASRPRGAKSVKIRAALESEHDKMSKALDGVGAAIRKPARAKARSANVAIKLRALQLLNLPQADLSTRLEEIMAEADCIDIEPTTQPQRQSGEYSVLASFPKRDILVSRHADLEVTKDNDRGMYFEHDAEE
jgi:hypothetical protein